MSEPEFSMPNEARTLAEEYNPEGKLAYYQKYRTEKQVDPRTGEERRVKLEDGWGVYTPEDIEQQVLAAEIRATVVGPGDEGLCFSPDVEAAGTSIRGIAAAMIAGRQERQSSTAATTVSLPSNVVQFPGNRSVA
jgi:hypothetical protein